MTAEDCADQVGLRTKADAVSIAWSEYAERVRTMAAGLAALGVKRGDSFGLMLTNRPEFHVIDSAAMHLGASCFSIYNTSAPEQIEYLLTDAANAVIVTERAFAERVLTAKPGVPTLEHVVVIDGPVEGTITTDEVESRANPGFDFDAAWRAVEPEDVLCLIYTSGTTGPPKGVQLTHANLVAEARALDQVIPLQRGTRNISFLPAAHIADRLVSHYAGMFHGFTLTCCPDPAELFAHVPDVRPTLLAVFPGSGRS